MKQLLFLLIFASSSTFAQCDTTDVVKYPDVEAQFPGGAVEMKKFIVKNIEYPPVKQYDCFSETGRLFFEFIVCNNGTIQNVRLIRPKSSEFAQMAIDLFAKMPNWIPAEKNGKAVASRCILPININLQ